MRRKKFCGVVVAERINVMPAVVSRPFEPLRLPFFVELAQVTAQEIAATPD